MTPEGIVKQQVAKSLACLLGAGDVLWYSRMNSGNIHQDGLHINMSEIGTFDFMCLFTGKDKSLCGAFIECKRADIKAVLSPSQGAFKNKYDGKHPHIYFWLVQSGKEVEREILARCYDRIKDIEL